MVGFPISFLLKQKEKETIYVEYFPLEIRLENGDFTELGKCVEVVSTSLEMLC